MAGFIASNTIRSVKKRLAVNRAVLEAIGRREGGWRVFITESPDKHAWTLIVKSTNGFLWTQRFEGKECTPSHVGSTVRAALEKAGEALFTALSDGHVQYVIDRLGICSKIEPLTGS